MARTIKFHLDEHCPAAVADGLRRRGIDVTSTSDAHLLQATDEDHLDYAFREGRVIFTHDDDFLKLHAAGLKHSGIAYCHQEARSIGEIIRGLTLVWEIYEPQDIKNRVEWI